MYRHYVFQQTMLNKRKAAHHVTHHINSDFFSWSENCKTSYSKCYGHISESVEDSADMILMDTNHSQQYPIIACACSVKGEEACCLLLIQLPLCVNRSCPYWKFSLILADVMDHVSALPTNKTTSMNVWNQHFPSWQRKSIQGWEGIWSS